MDEICNRLMKLIEYSEIQSTMCEKALNQKWFVFANLLKDDFSKCRSEMHFSMFNTKMYYAYFTGHLDDAVFKELEEIEILIEKYFRYGGW